MRPPDSPKVLSTGWAAWKITEFLCGNLHREMRWRIWRNGPAIGGQRAIDGDAFTGWEVDGRYNRQYHRNDQNKNCYCCFFQGSIPPAEQIEEGRLSRGPGLKNVPIAEHRSR